MLNSRRLFSLIVLLEVLVAVYMAWKIDHHEYDQSLFKQRHHKTRKWFDKIPKKRTMFKTSPNSLQSTNDENIILDNRKRGALVGEAKWPGGIVPYEIASGFTNQQDTMIRSAIQGITDNTNNCITFVPRNSGHTNWIIIRRSPDGGMCSSLIGMSTSGGQFVEIGDRCTGTVVQHEVLHALGFMHEQQRSDRDRYIRIIYDNIQPGSENQYTRSDSLNFDEPYNFGSIMHYYSSAISITPGLAVMVPTEIVSKEWRYNMGNSTGLSSDDVRLIKKYYGCPL